jgi:hypothetical protein
MTNFTFSESCESSLVALMCTLKISSGNKIGCSHFFSSDAFEITDRKTDDKTTKMWTANSGLI